MDTRLIEAAQAGDVDCLLSLIKDHPLILRTVALSSGDTPLHLATTAGQLDFVKQILKLRKEFAAELNPDGFSPLHIASANGDIEIVKELLEADQSLCRVKGREGRIPLHYAAIKGRVVVVRELLWACADSVEDATARGETALHLAVKNNQFEAFKVLVEHLMQHNKENVLRKDDERGNTVLHIAVSGKQYEVIDFLLNEHNVPRVVMELNSMNKSGLTALDVLLCFQSEAGDREIEEILQQAGAMRATELNSLARAPARAPAMTLTTVNENPVVTTINPSSDNRSLLPTMSQLSIIQYLNYFKFNKETDSPGDVRNCLLVISALIATATYQAVLSPPGGAWQDNSGGGADSGNSTGTGGTTKPHIAGRAIMQSHSSVLYGFFLYFNTLGFSLSLYMIQVLTSGFPMQLELYASIGAIVLTYDLSMAAFTPKDAVSIFFIVFSIFSQFVVPRAVALDRWIMKSIKRTLGISVLVNEPDV